MYDLTTLLRASLKPSERKQAEQSLDTLSAQPGFLLRLLQLVLDKSADGAVRLAGSIYLKNIAKLRWEEDVQPLPEQDKDWLRAKLVPAMLALSAPSDKATRVQISEAISLIAELDFSTKWPDLLDDQQLVASLSETDYGINVAILETAHSVFLPWRSHVRSDKLFTEINLVLDKFMNPYLLLFRQTATYLLSGTVAPLNLVTIAQAQRLLLDIYFDLTCQDLPPGIEDTHEEFFAPQSGWFQQFLTWDPAELRVDPDEPLPSLPSQIKTVVLEIAELFLKLYPDQLLRTASVEGLVQGVWNLLSANKLSGVADEQFTSQSLQFISTAIRSGKYRPLFGSREAISSLVEGVVVPNVGLRDRDLEQFEDDPLEFIRLDNAVPSLGVGGSDTLTRRQAASDLIQALVGSGYEVETTEIVGAWITSGLQDYNSDSAKNWRAKDSAIYLLTAVATRGWTMLQGVTSTNALVDVVKFFSDHIFQDLQSAQGEVHPVLQVDAIRFLHTFRNQLTKPQLLTVLPQLHRHLRSDNYVVYTYAAIAIERILLIKQGSRLLFTQTDTHEFAPGLLDAILTKVEAATSPEKMAENDHLMKCGNRVIVTARQTLTPGYEGILQRLVRILGVISKNPSNPLFDHYLFESISALIKFVVSGTPATLRTFEQALFPPFDTLIQRDVDQYIPYIFQVLAQMLHLHAGEVPDDYRSLLPFLLTPAVWQQKGSIPGIVKLLRVFLAKDSRTMVSTGQFTVVLAVIQQRLIPSKLNDVWGFELLRGVIQNVPPADLKPYFRAVIVTLLNRLQTSKTDKFVYMLSYTLMFAMALDIHGFGPDYVIGHIEEIQTQLWYQLLTNFILPEIPKMPHKDAKVVAVALTRMLTQSAFMMQEPNVQAWPLVFTAFVKLFREGRSLPVQISDEGEVGMTSIDYEEQTVGYQAAYSRLPASDIWEGDPVAYVQDVKHYLGQELAKASMGNAQVRTCLQFADPAVVGPFLQELAVAGFAL